MGLRCLYRMKSVTKKKNIFTASRIVIIIPKFTKNDKLLGFQNNGGPSQSSIRIMYTVLFLIIKQKYERELLRIVEKSIQILHNISTTRMCGSEFALKV